jgi:glycosyltransferase involved in cell wall biosynthesis
MKTLQVGNTDIVGTRFNGQDLHKYYLKKNIESQHCVWEKCGLDPFTWQLVTFGRKTTSIGFRAIEKVLSLQSVIYPYSLKLLLDKRFLSTDIVHYHLIHTGYFSLPTLPLLTRIKPTVWTLHDPWAMTGHCVYPYDCEKWASGCGNCPSTSTYMPMWKDNTALMWKIKKFSYHASRVDIVLASKWMLNMAQRSPLLSKFRLHHIPFGLDQEVFKPLDSEIAKKEIGVFPGSFVIAFRSINSEYKGLPLIREVLRKMEPKVPICLLTFNERGLMDEFRGKYQIIDLGWVDDEELTVKAYNASDIFLMPSAAEAFGMMAMEAMACGKPVITTEGTSLPEVIFAPFGGISVPKGDSNAMKAAIEQLIENPERRFRLGARALELANKHYKFTTHAEKMLELCEDVILRRKAGKNGG